MISRPFSFGLSLLSLISLVSFEPAFADSKIHLGQQPIQFELLAPLQMAAGMGEVQYKAKDWIAKAQKKADESGHSLKHEIIKYINKKAPADFRVYVSPDGKFRPDDGHHKILVIRELMRLFDFDSSELEWTMNVKADFSGKSWEQFARAMKELQVGYFPPEMIREGQKKGETPGELYQKLPADFSKIQDSPMRTAMGALYDSMGLEGQLFKPYAQFYFGDFLTEDGVVRITGKENLEHVVKNLEYLLFFDPRAQKYLDALIAMANPHDLKEVESAIHDSRKQFLKDEPAFKPDHGILPKPGAAECLGKVME